MNNSITVQNLIALIESADFKTISNLVRNMPETDMAELTLELSTQQGLAMLAMLSAPLRARLFSNLQFGQQDALLAQMQLVETVELFTYLPSDDRTDLYKRMAPEQRTNLLATLARKQREDIVKMASYQEGTVGAEATSDYLSVSGELTVAEALDSVRQQAPDKETIYTLYVVDESHRLQGTVSLRDLVLADPQHTLESLMTRDVITAKAEWPREEAAKLISRYDLLSVPVINGGDKLIGIVTVDDAMDVVDQETTEDFHKMGATLDFGKGHGITGDFSLKTATTSLLYRKRVFWLVLLVFGNIFSGAGIAYFEETIEAYIALVFFLPLLVDSGGNAGSQSATLMVRALATGDVVIRDWARMLGREFMVAVMLGLTMALAVSTIGIFRGGYEIAMVVSLSMILIVVMGSVIGMSLPFILSRMKLDPAAASAPLITSIADAAGVLIYFSIAVTILGSPV
ncbi:MAG: magnesium transporter [Methylophaga sp.]|nr:magnesium transporter [Methylophaga sp.]